jgi:precorrin-6B C5,15-methyltransferase / cobalt-precorrin-6B C5,C15-methyltransferase
MGAMITVVGLDGSAPDAAAAAALAEARVVAGGRRQLADVAGLLPPGASTLELGADPGAALARLAGVGAGPAVVLASGDPGFFGILRLVRERLGPEAAIRVLPATSSVSAAFARAGLAWDDALVVSAHGRDPAPAVNACRRWPKVAVLTGPRLGPAELGAALAGLDRRLLVAERLGTAAERVVATTPAGAAAGTWADPNVVLVLAGGDSGGPGLAWPARRTPTRWALEEDAFGHRDGMVTKAEVRALALAWLGPGVGDLVWDVGAGSGSVGVECALLGAAVVAVEPDPAQRARVLANARRHGVPVEVVDGAAPEALAALPDPDAVFVGGGGERLPRILTAAAPRARRAVVAALATVERVAPAADALAAAGLAVHGSMVQAARLAPLGGGHRLAAVNPVVLLRGIRG